MATLPKSDIEMNESKQSLDEAARQMVDLIEGYYDEIGLSESERDQRYASAREFLDSKKNSATAKPECS